MVFSTFPPASLGLMSLEWWLTLSIHTFPSALMRCCPASRSIHLTCTTLLSSCLWDSISGKLRLA